MRRLSEEHMMDGIQESMIFPGVDYCWPTM